jgi:flagellin FlaB
MVVTFVCGEKADVITFDETNSITGIGGGTSADEATANTAITAGKWGVINTYNDVGAGRNKLLEPGEQFVVKIAFPDDGTVLKPNTRFSVNLQPAIGAAFPIKKTVPSNLYAVTPV